MNEYQTASLIAESLVKATVDLGRAVGELRSIVKDEDARSNMPALLYSWAAYVTGRVSEEDRARLRYYEGLSPRQEWALQTARSRGRVAVADMRRRWPSFSDETLRLDLAGLVGRGFLTPVGDRRGRVYVSQEVGTGVGKDDRSSGNGQGVSEGGSGSAEGIPSDLKTIPDGESQEVGKLATRAPSAVMLHKIQLVLGRNEARWLPGPNGRRIDGARGGRRCFTRPGGVIAYEMDVMPELRARVVALADVLSFELQRKVSIEDGPDGFFVVVGASDERR